VMLITKNQMVTDIMIMSVVTTILLCQWSGKRHTPLFLKGAFGSAGEGKVRGGARGLLPMSRGRLEGWTDLGFIAG
jgi:hypothetical protein